MAAATAVLAGVLMWLLGVPFAGPLAVVVLLGAFVPVCRASADAHSSSSRSPWATRGSRARARPARPSSSSARSPSSGRSRGSRRDVVSTCTRSSPWSGCRSDSRPLGSAASSSSCRCSPSPRRRPASSSRPSAANRSRRSRRRDSRRRRRRRRPTRRLRAPTTSGLVPVWLDRLGQWSWRSLIVAALFLVVAQVALLFPG